MKRQQPASRAEREHEAKRLARKFAESSQGQRVQYLARKKMNERGMGQMQATLEALEEQKAYAAKQSAERQRALHAMNRQKLERRRRPLVDKEGRRVKSIFGGKPGSGRGGIG